MERINALNFAIFPNKGCFEDSRIYESAQAMIERTGCNYVILTPTGLQETAHSEDITWEHTVSDEELEAVIDFFHKNNIGVILKPTVNCKDGTWRAHISFFEEDVVCEPKWGNWFASYTEFLSHFAKIAEKTKCEMFITGCEMVQTDHREKEWRQLIRDIRKVYSGLVSYNCDKYQEHNVHWWDEVDVISSSGYYPIDDWERQLDRIQKVVETFNKPFFFAETGCMSAVGSSHVPNDWNLRVKVSEEEQRDWYEAMFSAIAKREFVRGTGLWSWTSYLYDDIEAKQEMGYDIYLKASESVVRKYYEELS